MRKLVLSAVIVLLFMFIFRIQISIWANEKNTPVCCPLQPNYGILTPDIYEENFTTVIYTPFDSNVDGYADSVEVAMDVDTTYDGIMNVTVEAFLYDPNGTYVAFNTTSWTINSTEIEWGFVSLYTNSTMPIGNYTVELLLYDDYENLEDERRDEIIFLYPPLMHELAVTSEGLGTTDPAPGLYAFPNGTEV